MSVLVSTKDLALVGGIGLIAFLILKGGRDLFGALPSLAQGLGDSGQGVLDFFGQAGSGITNTLGGQNLPQAENPIQTPVAQEIVSQEFTQVPVEQRTPFDALGAGLGGLFGGLFGNPETVQNQPEPQLQGPVPFVDPARLNINSLVNSFEEPLVSNVQPVPVAQDVGPALGGGPSFIGGQINEIPISRLSLADIVDRFNVSATQAANIKAESQNNFGDFDFGSNTGFGIGSVITQSDINSELNRGNVSNSEFEGLTLTEIAQRLTGGNINKF